MDLISHLLVGKTLSMIKLAKTPITPKAIIVGSVFPDIGEILLQIELSHKNKAIWGVYDHRTSDLEIASNINITWMYDISHSIPFALTIYLFSVFAYGRFRQLFKGFSIGLAAHILLDSFTHGHVWALKLFFPLTNNRYKILEDSIGNWWDWTPKVEIPQLGFGIPYVCVLIWLLLSLGVLIILKYKSNINHY